MIVLQSVNQMVAEGGIAVFVVKAENGPLTCQWLHNGVAMPGETNDSLTILDVKIADVALYSCNVSKALEIVPTREAQLMVYPPKTSSESAKGVVCLAVLLPTQRGQRLGGAFQRTGPIVVAHRVVPAFGGDA